MVDLWGLVDLTVGGWVRLVVGGWVGGLDFVGGGVGLVVGGGRRFGVDGVLGWVTGLWVLWVRGGCVGSGGRVS